jgi:hypothetical protein
MVEPAPPPEMLAERPEWKDELRFLLFSAVSKPLPPHHRAVTHSRSRRPK